ncbi:hypothetical protein ACFV9E_39970 [Streptomyces sp. NPDC059835]|uniref:hypothetical protein n=1 Tax=Streptomyces sp. NPDC059835 TaxID=3346967 RepID=UPI00364DD998
MTPAAVSAGAAAALGVALLCGGCGAGPPKAPGTAPEQVSAKAPATPSVSIEEIAAAIGCTAEVSVEAEELREGGCESAQGAYRMATFAADEGQRSWLAEARIYGGSYLVGNRWVVTAPRTDALTTLRERLGGSLDTGSTHVHHS